MAFTNATDPDLNTSEQNSSMKQGVININIRDSDPVTRVVVVAYGFPFFTIVVITIGVIVICRTSPQQKYQACGFQFRQQIIKSFEYDSYPTSLALGYFNNDTEFDIAVANSGTNNIKVFIGIGNGSFHIPIAYSTGSNSNPRVVLTEDINGDNQTDIVVANYGSHDLAIFLGQGNGTFENSKRYSTGSFRPRSIAMAKFNSDDRLDIAIVSFEANTIIIAIGTGDGSFETLALYFIGYDALPNSIVIGDFNRDNQTDIVVGNTGTSSITILLGKRNGTFVLQKTYSTGYSSRPSSLATGDFNNDNLLDIVVANSDTSSILVFTGHGNGTFSALNAHSISFSSYPQCVQVGDFDNDHRLDIALANSHASTVCVLLGYGNGSFSRESTFPTGSKAEPISIVVEDFDRDQLLDIAVANEGGNDIGILFGRGLVPFGTVISNADDTFSFSNAVATGDFNNDQKLDIAVVFSLQETIRVLLGDGNGNFTARITDCGTDTAMRFSLAVGDFNKDGRLDIVTGNSASSNIGVFLGYGNGTFAGQLTYSTGYGSNPKAVVIGDVNNDMIDDVVVANGDANTISIFLGYGNGTFRSQISYSTDVDSRPFSVALSDFNADGRLDIVVSKAGNNSISILIGHGDGNFETTANYSTGPDSFPISVIVDDFNRDTIMDIAVANLGTKSIGIFLGYTNETFATITTYFTGNDSQPKSLASVDFNNDKILDIFVANDISNIISLFIGYGDGTFARQVVYPIAQASLYSIVAGDFNSDGQVDTAVASYEKVGLYVLIGYYHVDFSPQVVYPTGTGAHPYSAAVGDFNGDNRTDIVVVNFGASSLSIMFCAENDTFNLKTYETGLGPTSAIVADFDRDTCPDIAVTNSIDDSIMILLKYDNYTFLVKEILHSVENGSTPFSITTGDLNFDHRLDIIVANQGTSTIGVYLGFDYATFEQQTTYSPPTDLFPQSVAIGDFNDDSQVDIIVVNYNGNTINIFFGDRNGTFGVKSTYSAGNSSSPTSVATGDFNNDSQLDFVIANSNAYNLGVYIGNGDGTFPSPVYYASGDASRPMSVAVGNLNNDTSLDIAVAIQWTTSIGILFGYGNGTFQAMIFYVTGSDSSPCSIALGDFNGDGRLDITFGNYNHQSFGILLSNEDNRFGNVITYASGTNYSPRSIAVSDLNNDNLLDIIRACYFDNYVAVYYGFGNGTFGIINTLFTGLSTSPASVAIADLNGDERPDIVVTLSEKNQLGIFFGCGNQCFVPIITYSTGSSTQPYGVAVGDLNDDHQPDIVVTNGDANSLGIYIGYIVNNFLTETTTIVGTNVYPSSVAVGHFNNDNQLDVVVVRTQANDIIILFGNGDGNFGMRRTISTNEFSSPCFVVVGNLNSDNQSDIVVVNTGTSSIGIFFSSRNGSFSTMHTYPTNDRSAPKSVALGDFNKDSRLDLVVANSGSNNIIILLGHENETFVMETSYTMGYDSRPYFVVAGDFNNDHHMDIAVMNYGSDTVGILLGVC